MPLPVPVSGGSEPGSTTRRRAAGIALRRAPFILAWIVAALLRATPGVAATWHIRADGSGDAPTIKAGVALASTGDVVLVESGSYVEDSIVVNKTIVVTGPPTNWPTISGRASQSIFRVTPSVNPTFRNMVLRDAGVGIIARNDNLDCGQPGAGMTAENLVLVSLGAGLDADDVACARGTAVFRNCTAINCSTAYQINDFGSVTGTNLVATGCQTALHGTHYSSASFSCLVFWGNVSNGGGPQPIPTSNVILADPRLCGPLNGSYGVSASSPCLPANNSCGALIGALGQTCAPVPIQSPGSLLAMVALIGLLGTLAIRRRAGATGTPC